MRVVFDTNVFVSALAFPGGQGDAAMRRIVEGVDELLLSRAILDELLTVLGRKFARDAEQLAQVAVIVTELSEMVAPRRRLKVLADEPDNRILECALEGRADAIVAGDKALLALKSFQGIPVQTLAGYLNPMAR
jgi:putative PIN family toxin of toxin-antitoxin system